MTNSTPSAPKPLRENWLTARRGRECQWEANSRLSEDDLREILVWAEEQLAELFMAQDLGANEHNSQDFLVRLDRLYDTIRNSMTRQDLILGFLLNIQEQAQEKAQQRQKDWGLELTRLTEPDIF